MVAHILKKADVKVAPKVKNSHLSLIGKVLVFAGKPLYLLFTYSILALLFISYWIGYSTRVFLSFLLKSGIKLLLKLVKSLKVLRLKIRLRLIKLPKLKLPKISPRAQVALAVILSFLFIFWILILKDIPSPSQLVTREREISTKIYDRNGILLFKIYKDENRTLVSLSQVPIQVRLATLAAEDAEFYRHPGFSIRGIFRSIIKNATRGELAGGSTITQQLVKNALLSSEKTIIRKIREIILAVAVEFKYTKDQILEMYLNEVSYG
ncbi:MAG: transglycosylase domain-containing protein, partial [Microgenomates group bacterium]